MASYLMPRRKKHFETVESPRPPRKPKKDSKKKGSILFPLSPRTPGQELLIDAIAEKPVTICDGPAGTGKTFVAFGSALKFYLEDPNINRIIIVRSTFTAGDEPELGFLPGTLNDKMEPFLAPILRDSVPLLIKGNAVSYPTMIGKSKDSSAFSRPTDVECILSRFDIEIIPLQLMRGRSLNNAFIILDEAQNCNISDFRLFISRMGKNSRIVIEGDSSQKDRPDGALPELMKKLNSLPSVATVKLSPEDIIRNPLIGPILKRLK